MMLNNVQPCLSRESLQRIGHNELSPYELSSIEEHVSGCDQCRELFDDFYRSIEWQETIQPALRDPVVAAPQVAEEGRAYAAGLGETRVRERILDLLGPTDDPNMLGRIGPYEIIGLLGQGGMGAVFKGFDRSLNRFVAIKMLLPHLAASGAARKRFAREGQAVAAVVDDHVMAIHCVDEWQGVPYLVMTYSRGVSLQKRLNDNGPLEVREILRIGMQAAKGLAAAHAQGIVHRDIKPANIFLDQNVERVQLMDFGLARAVDDASLTRSGTLAGTPQYMSPEQARAETVDHRSDLFSLGSVLYAMCTGHAPFRAESSYSVLRLLTDKEPRSIREINPDIPEWLCAIISKLMAKQVNDRFASAQHVAELLEECLAHVQQPTSAPLPMSLTPYTANKRSNFSGMRKGVIVMLGALGIGLLGMVVWQATEPPDISGQWTSDEWGTVVLGAKGPREYDGTFTQGFFAPGGFHDSHPYWNGNGAKCANCHEGAAGKVELMWSRVEHRFNGTWRVADEGKGKISLRLVGDEIRGAWTTGRKSENEAGSPRLGDFAWKRNLPVQEGRVTIGTSPGSEVIVLQGSKAEVEAAASAIQAIQRTDGGVRSRFLAVVEQPPVVPPSANGRSESGQLQLRVFIVVSITDLVRVGDSARIMIDAIPAETFSGKVVAIDKREPPRLDGFRASRYEVIVSFDEVPKQLKAGLTAEVEIEPAKSGNDGGQTESAEASKDRQIPTAAELEKQIQLAGRELFYGRMELTQEFKTLWTTKDQKRELMTSNGTARWLMKGGMIRIESDRMVPGTGTIELQPEQWTTGRDGDRAYSWDRVNKSISYGALRPGAIAYAPNLFFWGRAAIAFPQPMFGPNSKITQTTRNGREEIDVVVEDPQSKLSVRYVGIAPDRGYLPTRVESRTGERLESQVEFEDFFQPRPGVWAAKTILWTAWAADVDGKPTVASRTKFTVTKLELGDDAKIQDEEFQLKLPDDVKVVAGVPSNAKTPERIKPLDRQNVRAVVEAFVAAALAGDAEMVKALATDLPSVDSAYVAGSPKMTGLSIQSVYVNDPTKPTRALAVSETVSIEINQPLVMMRGSNMFTLIMSEEGWSVFDIDFEEEPDVHKALQKFLEAHPNAVRVSAPISKE